MFGKVQGYARKAWGHVKGGLNKAHEVYGKAKHIAGAIDHVYKRGKEIAADVLPEIDRAYGTRLHKGAMAAIGETDKIRSNIAEAGARTESGIMNHATNIANIGQRIRRAAPEAQPYLD